PSLQLAPSCLLTCLHPWVLSHESVVQGLPSSQFSWFPARQMPERQTSEPLHTLLSEHDVPSCGRAPAVQTPCWQVSTTLQGKPSLHEEPSGGTAPGTQAPA